MKTYVLLHNNEVYTKNLKCNNRGFFEFELPSFIKNNEDFRYAEVICIEDEIIKHKLSEKTINYLGLDEEVYNDQIWYNAFVDKNLNGFSVPIVIKTIATMLMR